MTQPLPDTPMEGDLLDGRYQLGVTLGTGGMATVRSAYDKVLQREVAIKLLRADLANDSSFKSRFKREAVAVGGLNHPNIVGVYDSGANSELGDSKLIPYIVMEKVDGLTIKDFLLSNPVFDIEKTIGIMDGLLSALAYSHDKNIVHRDVKPGNIMVTNAGVVKVMDFGIARVIDSEATLTKTSDVLGTAQYLSPEQARGDVVDHRADLYAAGCVLYEMLCASPPFVGESAISVAYQHVREDPIAPSVRAGEDAVAQNPEFWQAIDFVVLKALAKHPAERYQTAAQMQNDLAHIAQGEYSYFADIIKTKTPEDQNKKNWLIGLGAMLAVGLIVALIAATFLLPTNKEAQVDVVKAKTTSVPAVVGLDLQDGSNLLETFNLKVGEVTWEFSEAYDKNKILAQTPEENTIIEEQTTVDLVVSSGSNLVEVPDLTGKTLEEASQILFDLGLEYEQDVVESELAPGLVVESNPSVGQDVKIGSIVGLTISGGLVDVPNIIGQNVEEAREKLRKAGFEVEIILDPGSQKPAGEVLSQNPDDQTQLATGSIVYITVSSRKDNTRPSTPTPTATNSSPVPTTPPTTTPPKPTTPVPSTPPTTPVDEEDGGGEENVVSP